MRVSAETERPKPRRIGRIILGVIAASVWGWYINTVSPVTPWHVIPFLTAAFLTVFFLSDAFLRDWPQSFACASALTGWLILRAVNLRHPLYAILVVASLVSFLSAYRGRPNPHDGHQP